MVMQKKSLGEILVEKGSLSEEKLLQAKEVQKSAPGDLGSIIVDLGFASDKDVTAARANEIGIQFVDLSNPRNVDAEAVKAVPEHIIRRHNVLPIRRDNSVTPN